MVFTTARDLTRSWAMMQTFSAKISRNIEHSPGIPTWKYEKRPINTPLGIKNNPHGIEYENFAKSQEEDKEPKSLLTSTLEFSTKITIPGKTQRCIVTYQPDISKKHFSTLSKGWINGFYSLECTVIGALCSCNCIPCEKSRVNRHYKTPVTNFKRIMLLFNMHISLHTMVRNHD